jgi:hypothetical protein
MTLKDARTTTLRRQIIGVRIFFFNTTVCTMASMEFWAAIYMSFKKTQCSLSFIVINVIIINFDGTSK